MEDVARILRVDHAGEYGAIYIYSAQLVVARLFFRNIVPQLEEMLSHERLHFDTFNHLMIKRSIRHCYALRLWAIGGFVLGLLTALLGRNAIWICTHAIESTVLHHFEAQLEFLRSNDAEACLAVLSIKADEETHCEYGKTNGMDSLLYKPIFFIVKQSTGFAIWLSTKL